LDLDLDLESEILDEVSLHDPMDWEEIDMYAPMDIDDLDSDYSDNDMSLNDPMDVDDETDFQDVCCAMIFPKVNLWVPDPLCASSCSFIVDRDSWLVYRSLWLAADDRSTCGSYFIPLMDRRYL
jgi:hypothetical protein